MRGYISDSEGIAPLAGSDGAGNIERLPRRSHSFGWQTQGLWEWKTSREKIHLKMKGNRDAVERILNLGSRDFACNSHSASNWLCLIHILSPSYSLRKTDVKVSFSNGDAMLSPLELLCCHHWNWLEALTARMWHWCVTKEVLIACRVCKDIIFNCKH